MTDLIVLYRISVKPCACAGGEIQQCDLQAHVAKQSEDQTAERQVQDSETVCAGHQAHLH